MCKVKCYLEDRKEQKWLPNGMRKRSGPGFRKNHITISSRTKENWEWMDGKSLLSLKRQELLDVGVPTNLLPRLQSDIDRDDNHLLSSLLQCIRSQAICFQVSGICQCMVSTREGYTNRVLCFAYFSPTFLSSLSGTCQCMVSAVLGRDTY